MGRITAKRLRRETWQVTTSFTMATCIVLVQSLVSIGLAFTNGEPGKMIAAAFLALLATGTVATLGVLTVTTLLAPSRYGLDEDDSGRASEPDQIEPQQQQEP